MADELPRAPWSKQFCPLLDGETLLDLLSRPDHQAIVVTKSHEAFAVGTSHEADVADAVSARCA